MREKSGKTLSDVQEVYSGPEGTLWELLMGEQIHAGGWKSSEELADLAGISNGQKVLDLCSALGAGLRFLVRRYGVQGFGLDGTEHMVEKARRRTEADGLSDKIEHRLGNVETIPWNDETFDVVWGEDAWCYVEDKPAMIAESARVLKPGGTIAFTDWTEGPKGLPDADGLRICTFMKFPYVESRAGWEKLLTNNGFEVQVSDDLSKGFADWVDYYIRTVGQQKTFDALRIIGWDEELFGAMAEEMRFMAAKAHDGAFGRSRLVARKR
ncbi:methyltransferase domain-containing protein [Candidatus Fermentibacteria bacterium]|nr:methyltransferase domain-containing protein [Candidatus Fermentibacteria bacterium]